MMTYKSTINPPTEEFEEAIDKINKLAHASKDETWRADLYLKAFLDAVVMGAIREFTINGTTYEVCADVMETEE